MYKYYHVTPTRNVRSILRYGLRPAASHGLGLTALKGREDVVGMVHVTTDPYDARGLACDQYMEHWSEVCPNWTVLELYTRERGKSDPEFGSLGGFYFLTRTVPPSSIRIWESYGDEEGFLCPV